VFVDGEVSKHFPDTGQALFAADDCSLHQAVLRGADQPFTDNNDPLRIQDALNFHAKNVIIHDVHRIAPSFENHNAAGVMAYDGQNFILEHLEIFDTYRGIYIKGAQPNGNSGVIRYSRIRDVGKDAMELEADDGTAITARENVLDVQEECFSVGGSATAANIEMLYNTCTSPLNGAQGVLLGNIPAGQAGFRIENNIFDLPDNASTECINGVSYVQANSNFNIDANHCYQQGGSIRFAWNGATQASIAAFETASGATNTASGTPDFVDAANGDYRLGGSTTASGKGAYAVDLSREIGLQASPSL
jgi:predicted RecA/RadA family phage recombinase